MLNVNAQVRRPATLAKGVDAAGERHTENPEELLEDRKNTTVKSLLSDTMNLWRKLKSGYVKIEAAAIYAILFKL